MDSYSVEEVGAENAVFSPGVQSAVRAELALMLAAPAFAQSNRCKRFLSHIVQQTLSGHAGELKERMIGVNVFDRAHDYDTGEDSVVRVTSNEVRKRIGQFYRESDAEHAIQIELPRGSYVPDFRIRAAKRGNEAFDTSAKHSSAGKAALPVVAEPISAEGMHTSRTGQAAVRAELGSQSGRRLWKPVATATCALAIVAVSCALWRSHLRNEAPQLWSAFEASRVPILICLGAHDIPLSNAPSTPQMATFNELVLHKDTIPVDDATVLTSMASQLGRLGIPFRVAAADQVSLTDFRRQPAILIGGMDNVWTLRLTRDLRYRIEVTRPPNQEPIALIRDTRQPASAPWITDFSVPMSEWKNDYAIVARVDDPITGVPVMVDAGLGSDGSIAASELISSGALTSTLRNQPQCRGKSDFEAVVETNIIDTRPGPPHILRLSCW
jgi:hypothetical protein